jgi:hypothetical protein
MRAAREGARDRPEVEDAELASLELLLAVDETNV